MKLTVHDMDESSAKKILSWKYEQPYDFYNNEITADGLKELLDGSYKAVLNDHEDLFGFFCIGESAQIPIGHRYGVYKDNCVDFGLGMNPDYVGKGRGYSFCTMIMNFIKENYEGKAIRLSVATFNNRAIHLYGKLGFVKKEIFTTQRAEFMTMAKEN